MKLIKYALAFTFIVSTLIACGTPTVEETKIKAPPPPSASTAVPDN